MGCSGCALALRCKKQNVGVGAHTQNARRCLSFSFKLFDINCGFETRTWLEIQSCSMPARWSAGGVRFCWTLLNSELKTSELMAELELPGWTGARSFGNFCCKLNWSSKWLTWALLTIWSSLSSIQVWLDCNIQWSCFGVIVIPCISLAVLCRLISPFRYQVTTLMQMSAWQIRSMQMLRNDCLFLARCSSKRGPKRNPCRFEFQFDSFHLSNRASFTGIWHGHPIVFDFLTFLKKELCWKYEEEHCAYFCQLDFDVFDVFFVHWCCFMSPAEWTALGSLWAGLARVWSWYTFRGIANFP